MNTERAVKTAKSYDNQNLLRSILEKGIYFLLGVVVCRGIVFETFAPFGGSYVASVKRKNLFWATLGTSIG